MSAWARVRPRWYGLTDEQVIAAYQRFVASGATPAVPRPAATVILLRPPMRAYLIRRATTMAFAAGMHVFPGGTVDPRDASTALRVPFDLGQPPELAQALVCAAVREVFEETGVLLATPARSPGSTVDSAAMSTVDTSTPEWEAARVAVESRAIGFADLLTSHGLELRADLLAPWSRWITPEFEPRRYDTYFFVARLPAGQEPRYVGGESTGSVWVPVAEPGTLVMMLPTRTTLAQLAAYPDIDAVMSVRRDAVTPTAPYVRDGRLLLG